MASNPTPKNEASKNEAPEGVTTLGSLAADSPADNTVSVDAGTSGTDDKPVSATLPGGTKVTGPRHVIDAIKK